MYNDFTFEVTFRSDVKLSDLKELRDTPFLTEETITGFNTRIGKGNNAAGWKIEVRAQTSAARGQDKMNHGMSIKIQGGKDHKKPEFPLYISTNTYVGAVAPAKRRSGGCNMFDLNDSSFCRKNNVNPDYARTVQRFVYDNQSWLLGLWFIPDSVSSGNVKTCNDALVKYLRHKATSVDYVKRTANQFVPKTIDELNEDAKKVQELVRKELNDNSVELYFGGKVTAR